MNEERLYSVTVTEEELKLFSEFLEQREYAKHFAPVSARNELARRAIKMRKENSPGAITADKARRMRKEGYPKHYIDNVSRADNVRPSVGPNEGISRNEKLSKAAGERIRQEIARERDLLENRYAPKYTPDKFR